VIDAMIELLQRMTGAVQLVEARLRALELIAASGNDRFFGLAVDDLEQARQRLHALELSRAMAMDSAGLPRDISATEFLTDYLASIDSHHPQAEMVIQQLTDAYQRAEDAQNRTRTVIGRMSGTQRARLEASRALADQPGAATTPV